MLIGYSRVLPQDPDQDLQPTELFYVGCGEFFYEKQNSNNKERPELEACLKALSTGDTLVVWSLDKLGYSLTNLVEIVIGLEKRGIGFRSITENIDTTIKGGEIIFKIFNALAEFERNSIKERTLVGLEAARARGRKGGRRIKMDKTAVRKAISMLRDPQMTKTEVAKHFKVSRVTLNSALEREKKVKAES